MKLRPEEAKYKGTEWWVVKRTTNTESNEVTAMSGSLQAGSTKIASYGLRHTTVRMYNIHCIVYKYSLILMRIVHTAMVVCCFLSYCLTINLHMVMRYLQGTAIW